MQDADDFGPMIQPGPMTIQEAAAFITGEAFASELTPEGEQLLIPGCERVVTKPRQQLSLWG